LFDDHRFVTQFRARGLVVTHKRPGDEHIAARACRLYVESGCQSDHKIDNWLQAGYELLQVAIRELAKLPQRKPSMPRVKPKSIIEVVRAAML